MLHSSPGFRGLQSSRASYTVTMKSLVLLSLLFPCLALGQQDITGLHPIASHQHRDALALGSVGLDMISRMKVDAVGTMLGITVRWVEHKSGKYTSYQAWVKPVERSYEFQ